MVLNTCMKYVLEYIREEREGISEELIEDLNLIRSHSVAIDTKPLQEKIENILKKKHDAIDLMLEGIITKDDLKKQVEIYDAEIEKLSAQIANNTNLTETHREHLEQIRHYLAEMDKAENIDVESFQVYNSMLKKVVVHENCEIDYYLNCIPFGFHLTYKNERIPHTHNKHKITVISCEMI